MKEIRDPFEVYSSIVVGSINKKSETVGRLFTAALGQCIPRLGVVPSSLFPTHSPITTNVVLPAQLGNALGDLVVHALRLDFVGANLEDVQALLEIASYRLKVSAREMAEGALRDLPRYLDTPIKIDHNDTLDMDIAIGSRMFIAHPFLLRAVLVGVASYDVR